MRKKRNSTATVPQKILAVLADGKPHLPRELFLCLYDVPTSPAEEELAMHTLMAKLPGIRKELRPQGMDVLVEYIGRRLHYRLVRLIGSANTGRL